MPTMVHRKRAGFNLVELIIVIVVVGIIAAISIPRVTRGARTDNDTALRASLGVLRTAIELYASEHGGVFPGARDAGGPYGCAGSADAFRNQLLYYTDADGRVSETPDAIHLYGPYVRSNLPPLPVGANHGSSEVCVAPTGPVPGGSAGWVYNYETGEIIANCGDAERDGLDTRYNRY